MTRTPGRRRQAGSAGSIIRDAVDLRDLIYRPSLGLLPEQFLCAAVDPGSGIPGDIWKVRDQGDRASCIGEALAALVDIQRIETFLQRRDKEGAALAVRPASAAMLHAMALEIESNDLGMQAHDIYSLRSGLKGFYNTGVCTEEVWQSAAASTKRADFDTATVRAMREARNVMLGAYYRVRSFINDYHAALIEAGALYVSAELHGGWGAPPDGVIDLHAGGAAPAAGHAFVVVGYNRDGFLVLNSWGKGWGGYAFDGRTPLPGIGLWTYEDWASHVLDAWVLRLAPPTPNSFRHAIGQQGAAAYGADQPSLAAPSVRRLEVLGRYVNLDDGVHVRTGSFPSSRRSLETTIRHLSDHGEKGGAADFDAVRVTLHGDISPVDAVVAHIARAIPGDKLARVHGFSVIWINCLLDGAAAALQPLHDAALAIARGNRADADKRIEQMTGPVGRALWRDVKRAALVAGRAGGDAQDALARIVGLCSRDRKPLHLVTEGVGSLLLAELLRAETARSGGKPGLSDVVESLTLVAPLNTQREFDAKIGPFLEGWAATRQRRATILKPDAHFDGRLSVGAYSRSWTNLVRNAFERKPRDLVGAHDFGRQLRGDPKVILLPPPPQRGDDLSSADVLHHQAVADHVAGAIARSRRSIAAHTRDLGGE